MTKSQLESDAANFSSLTQWLMGTELFTPRAAKLQLALTLRCEDDEVGQASKGEGVRADRLWPWFETPTSSAPHHEIFERPASQAPPEEVGRYWQAPKRKCTIVDILIGSGSGHPMATSG